LNAFKDLGYDSDNQIIEQGQLSTWRSQLQDAEELEDKNKIIKEMFLKLQKVNDQD